MCGICGVVSLDDRRDSDLARLVQPMMAAMWHRGPDASGHLVEPGLALGMRRLSIIDRATGSQPFWNEDRTVAVIFNGEIYNFEELRQELTAAGPSLPIAQRHGGDRPCVRAVGRRVPDAAARHVRARDLRCPDPRQRSAATVGAARRAAAAARARSAGHQAAVLHARERVPAVRVGSARAAGERRRAPRSCRARGSKAICCSAR